MRLEDRFFEALPQWVNEQDAKKCVEISNAETIGFAYWITDPRNENVKGDISIEELLKIYQDETASAVEKLT